MTLQTHTQSHVPVPLCWLNLFIYSCRSFTEQVGHFLRVPSIFVRTNESFMRTESLFPECVLRGFTRELRHVNLETLGKFEDLEKF